MQSNDTGDESETDWTDAYEYRVKALVEIAPHPDEPGDRGPVGELCSDWDDRKDFQMGLAETLREQLDMTVQIERRPRAQTVDIESERDQS